MSLGYLYPTLFGFFALLIDTGAIVAVISFHARPRRGALARRLARSARIVGAASTVALALSITLLYPTLSTTDLAEHAAMVLTVLLAGLVFTLVAWLALLRRYGWHRITGE